MKKNIGSILYMAACLLLCVLPFAGMAAVPTNTTTENRTMASFPDIQKEGRMNLYYMQEMGAYFEDHFAFRPVLVAADSTIQSRIFGVSNMDTVIVGQNGWLYYTATLNDYLGQGQLTERGCYNAAHNLSLMQRYVEEKGASFQLAIAPNKNSLYGENMPYYYQQKVSREKNIDMLKPELEKCGVSYVDLFSVFEKEKEILYLKRDSHWNQKGAVLAYNAMLDALDCEHENYECVEAIRTETEYGDLNKMMYPLNAQPEWNYEYQYEDSYQYVTQTESVEDAWIQTANQKGFGSLLMFRDSFGNTLLPLMANTYKDGYFSKETPYNIEAYMELYHPQTVIVEKVERNIREFAMNPPIMAGMLIELEHEPEEADTDTGHAAGLAEAEDNEETDLAMPAGKNSAGTDVAMEEAEYDSGYWKISGILAPEHVHRDTNVYIRIRTQEETRTYEAFTVSGVGASAGSADSVSGSGVASGFNLASSPDRSIDSRNSDGRGSAQVSDNGYLCYLPKNYILSDLVHVDVLTDDGGKIQLVKSGSFRISEIQP